MILHELIDKDVPCCLYCNAEFDSNAISISSNSSYLTYKMKLGIINNVVRSDIETLYCVDCKETFEIYSHQSDDGETHYTGFNFTCKKLSIKCKYIESIFDISDLKGERHVTIPSFNPDFSDKDKLHEKLKTYLIFS